ncbi:MAG: dihydrolipoyl dehydrogenase [Deltaproteobacteria bacterium]
MGKTRVVIIGSGPGGYVAAIRGGQLGGEVTVIEDTEVGGTCLNRGCIPTKTLIASVETLQKLRHADEFGIEIKGEITFSMQKMMERKDKVVGNLVKGIRALFKSHGVNIVEGRGAILSPTEIEVTTRDGSKSSIQADRIIIATGSRPARMALFPFDGEKVITSDEALNLKETPKSVLIVGAGVIGCEFACILNELGSEVTMVEMMDRAVATEDPEIASTLERELKKKKIKLITSAKITKVEKTDGGVTATLEDGKRITAGLCLVSIGRALNNENIGLEKIGIAQGKRGEITVNERMETNIPGISAIGDVTGKIMLAHVASTQGLVAIENIMGHHRVMNYDVVPSGIFTMPEIGSVGLREHWAKEKGIDVKIGRFNFRTLGKAQAMGEITGMVKIIADAKTDKVLGCHIIGAHATDIIHEAAVAMQKGMTVKELGETIHSHPTLSEAVMEAAEDLHNLCIHAPKK